MPGSIGENRQWIAEEIQKMYDVRTGTLFRVLDVGPGYGTYGKLIKDIGIDKAIITAVEIFEPYVERFGLRDIYHKVYVSDIRTFFDPEDWFELVIFGDVLEHMTREESIKVFNEAKTASKWIIVSVPIIHWPQGEEFGNPHEKHIQEHLQYEDIVEMFGEPHHFILGEQTGAFVFKHDR